jgi:hypothetical protein
LGVDGAARLLLGVFTVWSVRLGGINGVAPQGNGWRDSDRPIMIKISLVALG